VADVIYRKFLRLMILPLLVVFGFVEQVVASEDLIALANYQCGECHLQVVDGKVTMTRMEEQRKTPEGWLMTVVRMQHLHGLKLTADAQKEVVKFLADNRGLAPAESESHRYILERKLNTVENHPDSMFGEMCARCHSGARVQLQRRSEQEWRYLVDFHLGQWPTLEYQSLSRDRDWYGIAKNQIIPYLTENFGYNSEAWERWQTAEKIDPVGRWRLAGNMPAKGDFEGVMTVVAQQSEDLFDVNFEGSYADGETVLGTGSAILYTGFEWRGTVTIGETEYQQIATMSASGEFAGRMFDADHEEDGIDLTGVKGDSSVVLAVSPEYVKAGGEQTITIVGNNLNGDVTIDGLTVSPVSSDADSVVVKVMAPTDGGSRRLTVSVGAASLASGIAVYDSVAAVNVLPAFAVGRVGGNGGAKAPVTVSFDAEAIAAGADGEVGTDDDVRIGYMPASWDALPWDHLAVRDEDLKFAGELDPVNGVFSPSLAGPNPDRKYGTNNAGHLAIQGTVQDGENSVSGKGELIVTVQRFNNPPIR